MHHLTSLRTDAGFVLERHGPDGIGTVRAKLSPEQFRAILDRLDVSGRVGYHLVRAKGDPSCIDLRLIVDSSDIGVGLILNGHGDFAPYTDVRLS